MLVLTALKAPGVGGGASPNLVHAAGAAHVDEAVVGDVVHSHGDLVGVGRVGVVLGLIHREPHHVVRVHEGHRQEPGLVEGRGVGPQPRRGVRRDDRVEVHAGAGPAHEVLVVALPVGEAVGGHVD